MITYRTLNPDSQLVWVDRAGHQLGAVGDKGRYVSISLSPDAKKVALEKLDADNRNGDVWIVDLSRGLTSRFTFDPDWDSSPIWSPDGSEIAFSSNRHVKGNFQDLYVKAAAGGGNDNGLFKSGATKVATSWSPDGKYILFSSDSHSGTSVGLYQLRFADGHVTPYLQSSFNQDQGQFSPDGKWVAYVSDESGKPEVYVQSFPVSGAKWQISTAGGSQPQWRKDGKELFFLGGDKKLWSAAINLSPTFEPQIPQALFSADIRSFAHNVNYVSSADGQRFLINTTQEDPASSVVNVLFNWTSELRK